MNHAKDQYLNELIIEAQELVFYNSHHIAIIGQSFERPISNCCGRQIYSRILLWNGFEYIGQHLIEEGKTLKQQALETTILEVRRNVTKYKFV